MSPAVQVFGRRNAETIHGLGRPESEKRQARSRGGGALTVGTLSEFTLVDYQPERLPPPSWGQRTPSLCGGRRAFRPRLRGRQRPSVCARCDAARRVVRFFLRRRHFGSPGRGSAVPTIVFHGDRDTTVHPSNGDHVIAQSKGATNLQEKVRRGRVPGGHSYSRTIHTDTSGRAIFEHWAIHGAGHAWSGGSPAGSYTDPRGPDAAREMLRFFREHPSSTATP
jgi:hypothetical protein